MKILCLVFSLPLFAQVSSTTPVLTVEYQALVDFYNATNGASWANKWDISSNSLHITPWYGVTIDNGHVVGITLHDNRIYGAIPASFSNLKYLKTLDFSYYYGYGPNDFSSTDLDNLSGLENLELLNLYYCNLKGSLPISWSKLIKLKTLNLKSNAFEGPIFDEIGDLKELVTIDFSGNKFTSIPTTIGSLTKLTSLYLGTNQLTALPKELENLTSLTSLNVDYNQIADTQALLKTNISLSLYYQSLSLDKLIYKGDDVVLTNLPRITKYDRSKNDFSALNNFRLYIRGSDVGVNITMKADGSLLIPKQYLSSLKKGDEVYLYQNTGAAYTARVYFKKVTIDLPAIPEAEYQALVDFYNACNGPNWIYKWDVSVNNLNQGAWYGISIEGSHIVGIDLGDIRINGAIPASFSNLKFLRNLNLSYRYGYRNDLSTTDLNNLSGLESLETLGLYYCNVKGAIPSTWSRLTKLKSLDLNNNAVTNVDANFATLKLTGLNFNSQTINMESIEIGANEINVDLPLHMVVAVNNQVVTFDAKNEFRLYVNGVHKKTAFSNNGKLIFSDINLLNLKETDQLRIYQVNGIAYNTSIYYDKITFGKPLVDEEFEILKKIYAATNGASWTNKWNVDQNNLNTVSWFGVTIKDGHVIYINLFNNNLSGTIPEEITGLKFLKTLNLSNNKIEGTIPNTIYLVSNLENLDLNSNLLTGVISSRIAELQKLKKFSIGNNKFSGTIPSALSDFVALEYLDVSSNSFDKIDKKLYYDYAKTYIDLRNQKINYAIVLSVSGSQLKVNLNDIVKYDLEKNNFEAKNSFALLVNNVTHTTTVTNELGEIIFDNVRIGEIPVGAKIAIRQTTGSFINTEFNFIGIEDKSNIQVVDSEYLALIELNNKLNGSQWTNKWDVVANNLHIKKWFGVTTYDGHIVSINLNANNVSGIVPNLFDKFPYLNKLNLTSNKLTGVEAVLPSTIDFTFDRQAIDLGIVDLSTATVINDLSINKYEHAKKGFFNQTYDLRIGGFSRTVNIAEQGIKLIDIMTTWTVPNNQKIELRQISGDAKNSVIGYNLKFKMGDSNLDNKLNVLDVQTTINYILSNYVNYFNYNATDINYDTKISVLDVIGQVKIIQNQVLKPAIVSNNKSIIANRNTESTAKLSIENGQLMLDTNGYDVASFEIRINNTTKEAVKELMSTKGFTVNLSENNNQVSIIAYSFDKIVNGKIALANISQSEANVVAVILSDVKATEIPSEIVGATLGTNDTMIESLNINNYPNPFSDETTIEFISNLDATNATLSIYDLGGRKVQETQLNNLVKGQNQFKFSRQSLQSGIYLYRITAENNKMSYKGKMTIN